MALISNTSLLIHKVEQRCKPSHVRAAEICRTPLPPPLKKPDAMPLSHTALRRKTNEEKGRAVSFRQATVLFTLSCTCNRPELLQLRFLFHFFSLFYLFFSALCKAGADGQPECLNCSEGYKGDICGR